MEISKVYGAAWGPGGRGGSLGWPGAWLWVAYEKAARGRPAEDYRSHRETFPREFEGCPTVDLL
jgi:hypothetical protein